jgi:recombination protein RecA
MATLDRDKALDMALAQIDKQFGKGSVMRLGDSPEVAMKVIPTGSIALDIALGIGGLPSSTRSTRSTRSTPAPSASTPTPCW